MTLARVIELSALLLATLTAWLLTRRAPAYRPIAHALTVLLAIDVARLATRGHPAGGLAWSMDVVLVAGWYAVPCAVVCGVLWGER